MVFWHMCKSNTVHDSITGHLHKLFIIKNIFKCCWGLFCFFWFFLNKIFMGFIGFETARSTNYYPRGYLGIWLICPKFYTDKYEFHSFPLGWSALLSPPFYPELYAHGGYSISQFKVYTSVN